MLSVGMSVRKDPAMTRPWKEVAKELAVERDTTRIVELSEELDRALTEQTSIRGEEGVAPTKPPSPVPTQE